MCVIVPNHVRDAIHKAIDDKLAGRSIDPQEREGVYDELLYFYDKNGVIPDFSLEAKNPYESWIGQRVRKSTRRPVEPKPFKSGSKVNTVAGIIDHPQLPGQKAFTFIEDDSYVACRICQLLESTT